MCSKKGRIVAFPFQKRPKSILAFTTCQRTFCCLHLSNISPKYFAMDLRGLSILKTTVILSIHVLSQIGALRCYTCKGSSSPAHAGQPGCGDPFDGNMQTVDCPTAADPVCVKKMGEAGAIGFSYSRTCESRAGRNPETCYKDPDGPYFVTCLCSSDRCNASVRSFSAGIGTLFPMSVTVFLGAYFR